MATGGGASKEEGADGNDQEKATASPTVEDFSATVRQHVKNEGSGSGGGERGGGGRGEGAAQEVHPEVSAADFLA